MSIPESASAASDSGSPGADLGAGAGSRFATAVKADHTVSRPQAALSAGPGVVVVVSTDRC